MITSCAEKAPKSLILYYSQTGTTAQVAEELQAQTGADIECFDCVEKYDGDFEATIQRCLKEQAEGFTPTYVPIQADLSKYDVIYLGYPVWFGTYAPPVAALLQNVDLSGKKIIPFCTFGSGGLESSSQCLKEACPAAEILPGYGVRAARVHLASAELDWFLKANGLKEGTVTPLPDYSEMRDITPEEAAIYDEATAGYPFPMGEAVSVGSRAVEGGTDYIFKTKGMDREGREMFCTVFVIARDGAKAEFTRVNR